METNEFLNTFEIVISKLSKKFVFGYFEEQDIRQEAFIFAQEALAKWDKKRPLENFMYIHIKNQLINLKRDLFHRADSPCKICGNGGTHDDGKNCAKYLAWKRRNAAKSSLMSCSEIPENFSPCNPSMSNGVQPEDQEIFDKIRAELPEQFLELYLRWKSGDNIPKNKKNILIEEIRRILNVNPAAPSADR